MQYGNAQCTGTGTLLTSPTGLGYVVFDRTDANATLSAFWGAWTQPSGPASRNCLRAKACTRAPGRRHTQHSAHPRPRAEAGLPTRPSPARAATPSCRPLWHAHRSPSRSSGWLAAPALPWLLGACAHTSVALEPGPQVSVCSPAASALVRPSRGAPTKRM